ncbi:MAG: ATP synthase F1 subunit epsilon [Eubacteriales bacterium]|nr:ATP synthase F1 subunit epsilon [Eubacteriales bacterium]MDD4476501.1 ATP synthase F1 subunit epsilon [Eubacteriales bacterium]
MAKQELSSVETKKINLTITTPRGVKFVEKADMIIMRCIDGNLGVLPGHEAISTVLGDGILRIYNNGVEKMLAVFGGVANINETSVEVFSTIAQRPEEIDLERAEADRREAEAMLLEKTEKVHIHNSQVILRRSLVRIEVNLHLDDNNDDNAEDDDS